MLSDRLTQLLTAYIDGELSARQRKAVTRLLERSPQARELLRRLEADSRTLRALPRQAPARDLSGDVLRTIAARRLSPAQRRRARAGTSVIPVWAGFAAAASVLL